MPWFLLYPLIGAALGAGGAKVTGNKPGKGALLGAGLGLGAGALPLLGGAASGGSAGWGSLISGKAVGGTTAAAAKTAAAWQPNTFGALLGKAGGAIAGAGGGGAGGAAGAAGKASMGGLAKTAAMSALAGTAVNAALPKYGQSQLLMDPGFMQAPPDTIAQLQELMKKGRMS